LATGDFNGDGKSDLATANNSDGNISVLLGSSNGTLSPQTNFAVGQYPESVAAADVNGDGRVDLVVANHGNYSDFAGTVSILLGNGNGTFVGATNLPVGFSTSSVTTADVNNDGVLERVLNFRDDRAVWLGWQGSLTPVT
jgi:hypothetical protein